MIKKYILAWFGMMVLAILNGTIRDFTYKPYTGALAAHQISTVTLLLLFAAYVYLLMKRWQIPTEKQAITIGVLWFIMTELFEFGLGLRRGMSLEELLYMYNLAEGQVWLFVPLFTLLSPWLFRRWLVKE